MAEDAAMAKTGIFGGMSVCCFVCLFVFGIPLLIAGIIMIIYGWWVSGVYITGIIFVVLASLMALVGFIALILTCVYGSKIGPGGAPRQQGPTVVVAPTVFATSASQQPVGYYGTQPAPQQQPMGYSGNYPPPQHSGNYPPPQQQPGGYYGTNPATQPAYMSTSGGPHPPAYQSTHPDGGDGSTAYDRPPAYNEPPKPHIIY